MKPVKRERVAVAAVVVVLSAFIGCAASDGPQPSGNAGGAASGGAPAGPTKASASSAHSALPAPVFNDGDFTESDGSRDPFHNYSKMFAPVAASVAAPQYTVILEKYTVDELKLVAVVNAGDGVRAMFVDPAGKGWVVTRGMHVGKGEMVRIGPSATSSYPLYWKIDRIKDDSVILVREDSLHPEIAPTYREILLHNDAEKT